MEIFKMLSEKDKPIANISNIQYLTSQLANEIKKWCYTNKNCKSFVKRYNK